MYATILKHYAVTGAVEAWKILVVVLVFMLDSILDKDTRAKDAMRRGAKVRVRRAVRGV